jgi:hypothetical protein
MSFLIDRVTSGGTSAKRRHRQRPGQERLSGQHLRDEADAEGFLRLDEASRQHHLPRPVPADDLGQEAAGADLGSDAQGGVAHGEARPFRGQEVVRREDPGEAAADGVAVDGADHGLDAGHNLVDRLFVLLIPLPHALAGLSLVDIPLPAAEVGARAEGASGAGDDDGGDGGVGVSLEEGPRVLDPHHQVDAVEALGAVEGDDRDPPSALH